MKLNFVKGLLGLAFFVGAAPAAQSVEYRTAKITKIVGGDSVFIDQKKAAKGETAQKGSTLRTGESRASLLFNPTAIGLMNRNTSIRLGNQCFRGERGTILVNCKLIACLGEQAGRTKLAGSRGTTYVLSKEEDGSSSIYVLAGEVVVADSIEQLNLTDDDYQIVEMYPHLSPSLGVSADLFAMQEPRQSPVGFGTLSLYAPLSQSKASEVSYGYASTGSDFERYFGVDVELGHRWFDSSNQSTKGFFLGYSNYQSSQCSNSYITTGLQYEKSRFRYGASGGFKADACEIGFSYGQLDLSIPIFKLSPRRSAHLTLSPYVLWGNDILSLHQSGSSDDFGQTVDVAPGGRLTFDLPVSDGLKLSAYGSYDEIYGYVGGGRLSYRLPLGGGFVQDPNDRADSSSSESASTSQLIIEQGEQARFSAQGDLIGGVDKISPQKLEALLVDNLAGQDRLPESLQLANLAEDEGVLSTQISAILGIDFDRNASLPVSRTLNSPYSDSFPPTIKYQPHGYSWKTWRRRSLQAD